MTWLDCVFAIVACDCPALASASPVVALEMTAGGTISGVGWIWPPFEPPEDGLAPGGGVGNSWLPAEDGSPVGNGGLLAVLTAPGLGLLAGEGLGCVAALAAVPANGLELLAAVPTGDGLGLLAGTGLDALAALDWLAGAGLAAVRGEGLAVAAAAAELDVVAVGLLLLAGVATAGLAAFAGCDAAAAVDVEAVAVVPVGPDFVVDDAVAFEAVVVPPELVLPPAGAFPALPEAPAGAVAGLVLFCDVAGGLDALAGAL